MAKLGKKVKGKSKKGADGDDGGGKKGKGGKGTSEDKALAAKLKALEEADAAKRQAEAERRVLKELLAREAAMTKMNKRKVQNAWLKIMRLAKVDSLRRDIEVLSQNHERDVDRKDALLQMLDRDLDDAEEQFQLALREHLRNVDELIQLQDVRLNDMERQFDKDLEELTHEFKTERDQIIEQHRLEKAEVDTLIQAIKESEDDKAAEAKQEGDTTKEEVRNRNIEEINILSSTLDQQIEELEANFEREHLKYLQKTDSKTTEFKRLTKEGKRYKRDVDDIERKMEATQRQLDTWKSRLASHSREFGKRNDALTAEKNEMLNHTRYMKRKLHLLRTAANKRLAFLSGNAKDARTKLYANLQVAEAILLATERTKKLETAMEKVVPYYRSTVDDDEAESKGLKRLVGASPEETITSAAAGGADPEGKTAPADGTGGLDIAVAREMESTGELRKLDNYFKKYNKVLLDKLNLENERNRLKSENEELSEVLKQYMEGITVTEDTVKGDNPLLAVNGRTRVAFAPKEAEAPITVVDGNHMVATGRARV